MVWPGVYKMLALIEYQVQGSFCHSKFILVVAHHNIFGNIGPNIVKCSRIFFKFI